MRDYRNFFASRKSKDRPVGRTSRKTGGDGCVRVAFYTELFKTVTDRHIATNSEYAALKNDIMDSIEPYGVKDRISLSVYESEESSDFGRESTVIGFHKYLKACTDARMRTIWKHISLFGLFLLLGIAIEVGIYAIPAVTAHVPAWVCASVEVLGNLFIWQFGGYLAFEFPGEIHSVRKYRQITDRVTFEFKHFE